VRLRAPAATSWLSATRARAIPTAVWLGAIVVLSTALRIALGATVPVPTIFPDELVYWELARSVGESGQFMIGGEPVAVWSYGPLYPLAIAPIHAFGGSLDGAYAATKAVNALLMSLAALPAYFLARRLLSLRGALVVAAVSVLVPSAVYTTRVMAESVSYPVFLCAMLAGVAALEHPSAGRQLLALATICLATLGRFQMIVLLPALLCAIVVVAWAEARERREISIRRRLSDFWLTWIFSGAMAVAVIAVGTVTSVGAHTVVLHDLQLWRAPAKALWHVADLDLYSGVIPLTAFVLVVWSALASRDADPGLRAFAALGASAAIWLVLLAGVYTTAFPHVFDRYVFYVVPLFLIALVAWIERRVASPKAPVVACVLVLVTVLPLTLPFDSLLNGREWGTSTSAVGLVPWAWVGAFVGEGWLLNAVAAAFAGVLALAVWSARTAPGWSLLRITVLLLVLSGVIVSVSNSVLSDDVRPYAGSDPAWIDAAAGSSPVAILYRGTNADSGDERLALREAKFFNRRVGPVYELEGPFAGGFPSTQARVTDAGRLVTVRGRPVRAEFLLAHRSLGVNASLIATSGDSGLDLYRTSGQVRLESP
jgi:Dolichyl-phosphate-mannose-protein mannosyltransferase